MTTTDPMTDEELASIGRRIDARDGSDHYAYTIDGIGYDGHWAHDTRRLLAEVDRLNREHADFREMSMTTLHSQRAELDRLRAENTAQAADWRKVVAARIAERDTYCGEATRLRSQLATLELRIGALHPEGFCESCNVEGPCPTRRRALGVGDSGEQADAR